MRRVLFTLILTVAAVCAAFPYLLSTPPGRLVLSKILSHKLGEGVKVSIADASLSWFGHQEVQGLAIQEGETEIFIQTLKSSNTLPEIVFSPSHFMFKGTTTNQNVSGDLEGEFVIRQNSIPQFHLRGQKIPSKLIENLLEDPIHFISQAFGPEVNVALGAENGFLRGTVDSERAHITMNGDYRDELIKCVVDGTFKSGLLKDIFGEKADFRVHYDQILALRLNSELFKSQDIKLSLKDGIKLLEGTEIDYQVSSPITQHIIPIETVLIEKIPLKLKLSSFELPQYDLHKLECVASLQSPGFRVNSSEYVGSFEVRNFLVDLRGIDDLDGKFDVKFDSSPDTFSRAKFQKNSLISQFLFNGHWGFFKLADLDFSTTGLSGTGEYSLQDENFLSSFEVVDKSRLPSKFYGSVKHFTIPFNGNLDKLVIQGMTQTDPFAIDEVSTDVIALSNWDIEGPKNRIVMSISTLSAERKEEIKKSYSAFVTVNEWLDGGKVDFEKIKVKSDIQFKHVPLFVIEKVAKIDGLTALFGDTIEAKIKADFDLERRNNGQLNIQLVGKEFKAQGALNVDEFITLKNPKSPMTVEWTLTPDRFRILRLVFKELDFDDDHIGLNKPTTLRFKIADLSIPWTDQQHNGSFRIVPRPYLGLIHSAFTAGIEIENLSLSDIILKQTTEFKQMKAKFATHDLFRSLKIDLKGAGSIRDAKIAESLFDLEATVENPLTDAGGINHEEATVNLKARSTRVPLSLFTEVSFLSGQLKNEMDALVGDYLDCEVDVKYHRGNGPVLAVINGSQGKLNIDGQVRNGILTLNKPVYAHVKVTPELSKSMLADLVPILKSVDSSDKPITITIPHEHFALPLSNWNPSKVSIQNATVDFGLVQFSYGKDLEQILSLLHYKYPGKGLVTVWFTPLYFSFNDGVMSCHRIDMLLANYYPIALWGKVDFQNDKVKLTLGVSGTAIKNAFGVKGLPPDTLVQFPIKGTVANAKIDTKKAATKISSLVLHAKGGPEGLVIGGLIDIIGGNVGEKKPPPPTTSPLPWTSK